MSPAWSVLFLTLAFALGADDASLLQARLGSGMPGLITGYMELQNLHLRLFGKTDKAGGPFHFGLPNIQEVRRVARQGMRMMLESLDEELQEQGAGLAVFNRVNAAFKAVAGRGGLDVTAADEGRLRQCKPLLEEVIYEHELHWNRTVGHAKGHAHRLREFYTDGPGHIIQGATRLALRAFSEETIEELDRKFIVPINQVAAIIAANPTTLEALKSQFLEVRGIINGVNSTISQSFRQLFHDEASGKIARDLALARAGITMSMGAEVADMAGQSTTKMLQISHATSDVVSELAGLYK